MVRPVSRSLEAKHARFAAACAIADLIDCGDVYHVAEKYGVPKTASHGGISVGQLQNLLADVAKWAGMAVSVCQAAGGSQMKTPNSYFQYLTKYAQQMGKYVEHVLTSDHGSSTLISQQACMVKQTGGNLKKS